MGEFFETFEEELIPVLHKVFQKVGEDQKLPNSFYVSGVLITQPKIT